MRLCQLQDKKEEARKLLQRFTIADTAASFPRKRDSQDVPKVHVGTICSKLSKKCEHKRKEQPITVTRRIDCCLVYIQHLSQRPHDELVEVLRFALRNEYAAIKQQRVSRLVRSTLSFSKNLANHIGAIKYFICDYNLTKSAALPG